MVKLNVTESQNLVNEISKIIDGVENKCKKMQKGLSLSKQGLHKRLAAGKEHLKKVLAKAIENRVQRQPQKQTDVAMILTQFRSVLLTNSSTISLPDKIENEHKGMGGTNANSALKIQTTYDVKNKNFKPIVRLKL